MSRSRGRARTRPGRRDVAVDLRRDDRALGRPRRPATRATTAKASPRQLVRLRVGQRARDRTVIGVGVGAPDGAGGRRRGRRRRRRWASASRCRGRRRGCGWVSASALGVGVGGGRRRGGRCRRRQSAAGVAVGGGRRGRGRAWRSGPPWAGRRGGGRRRCRAVVADGAALGAGEATGIPVGATVDRQRRPSGRRCPPLMAVTPSRFCQTVAPSTIPPLTT